MKDDSAGGSTYRHAGVMYPGPHSTGSGGVGDWGYIRWNDSVQLGDNAFSSDARIDPSQVRNGEKVCGRGVTSHQASNGVGCGWFVQDTEKDSFEVVIPLAKGGDSGGPLWLERNGQRYFLGVLSMFKITKSENFRKEQHFGVTPNYSYTHPQDTGTVDVDSSPETGSAGADLLIEYQWLWMLLAAAVGLAVGWMAL